MRYLVVLLALISVSACTSAVHMGHPVTGKTVQCGPYYAGGFAAQLAAVERERGCVADYHRQGYERVMR